jgi:hypothetical protein
MDVITVYDAASIIEKLGIKIPEGATGFKIHLKADIAPTLVFDVSDISSRVISKQLGVRYEGDIAEVNKLICSKVFPDNPEITDVTIIGEIKGKYEIVTTTIEEATSSKTLETLIKILQGESK